MCLAFSRGSLERTSLGLGSEPVSGFGDEGSGCGTKRPSPAKELELGLGLGFIHMPLRFHVELRHNK